MITRKTFSHQHWHHSPKVRHNYVILHQPKVFLLLIYAHLLFAFQALKFGHCSLTVHADSKDTEHNQQALLKIKLITFTLILTHLKPNNYDSLIIQRLHSLCPLCVKIRCFTNEARESGAIYVAERLGSSRCLTEDFLFEPPLKVESTGKKMFALNIAVKIFTLQLRFVERSSWLSPSVVRENFNQFKITVP